MKKNFCQWLASPALCAFLASGLFVCSTWAPDDEVDDSVLLVRLSLNREGIRDADFSGEPLTAILEFNDTVGFDEIYWELGQGMYLYPAGRRSDTLHVPVFWGKKGMPKNEDTLTGELYEEIYVSCRGVQSNKVRVNVLNRAPVIDTLYVGDTAFFVGENIYFQNVYTYYVDTSLQVHIFVKSTDYDNDVPTLTCLAVSDSLALKSYTTNPMKRVYQTPMTNFRDTVLVDVYDGHGGKAVLKLVLARVTGITAVEFDSILVNNTTMLRGSAGAFRCSTVSFDTLPLNVFTNTQFPVFGWTAGNGTVDSLGPQNFVYRCTLAVRLDTLTVDTAYTIDVLNAFMTNGSLDTARISISIVKKPLNRRPVLDSIWIDGVRYDSIARVQGGISLALTSFAHDPDGTTPVIEWRSKASGRIQSQGGSTATYVCLVEPYVDTIIATAADNLQFYGSDTVRLSVNLAPVIDSLRINSTHFTNPVPAEITFDGTLNDSIDIVSFARDPEGKDFISSWVSRVPYRITAINDLTVRYKSLDDFYSDTLTGTFADIDGFSRQQRIIIRMNNRRPAIDSVVTPLQSFLSVSYDWTYTATAMDSIHLQMYMTDADNNIATRNQILNQNSIGTLTFIDLLNTESWYVCGDSLYRDTVTFSVTDFKGAVAQRKLVINVNNR
jgi:hypothetical protein